jgi:hypothetical protein
MRDDMKCLRAEDLLSDHLEGTLDEPLLSELAAHLTACAGCRALRDELAFVVETLHEFPEVEPAESLATRAAEAAIRARKVVPFVARESRAPGFARSATRRVALLPAWAQSLAAGLALITAGTLLLTARTEAPARAAAQIAGATVRTGAYLAERKDRLFEDVRVLRVVIETAFEGRIDRVEERVEDYRRLLERRKPAEGEGGEPKAPKTNDTRYTFPNPAQDGAVTLS